MNKCDVIIPIYNAYDCLKPCIDSVLNCTDMKNNRIILINDKSTDERVLPLLKEYENKKNIILLENEENLGFVGTVNRGMKYSKDNDVLLLNSDTEVTPRWLEKVQACAYNNPMVATVTPLSNNATLASVPVAFERNELPEGISLNEMGQLVEECSLKSYPELPTGHGFCLFIKRSVLNEVGFFDDVAFKKGYGEENDFCFRCFDKGYRHLLADDTYIYHKESQSFTTKKLALMQNGERVLSERYPFYKSKLNSWIYMKPIDYIGANIASYIGKKYNKKNILFLIHDFRNYKTNNGGTTLHAYDLISNLRNKYNFHVLSYENGLYRLTSFYKNTECVINIGNQFNCNRYTFYNNAYEKMVENIIDSYGIDAIHIHHMQYHYFNICNIIEKKKIPTVLSLHDFYCVCPLINKLYTYQSYCGKSSREKCGECLKKSCGVNYNFINEWHECYNKLFNVCKKIIVPTNSTKEEVLKTYNNLKMQVIEHGVDMEKEYSELTVDTKEFNVAFLGAIGIHKGRNILVNMFEKKLHLKNIKIHVFGEVDAFNKKNTKNYINHGRYKREELAELLKENNIQLVCLLSICPETYSYTLTESIANGIPVLGFDIGAIGERIKKDKFGWVIDYKSNEKDVLNKLFDIYNDKKGYKDVIDIINNYKTKTTKEMSDEYDEIYEKIDYKQSINYDKIVDINLQSGKFLSQPAYPNYEWIFSTFKWKLFTKLKLPKSVKKVIKKIARKG